MPFIEIFTFDCGCYQNWIPPLAGAGPICLCQWLSECHDMRLCLRLRGVKRQETTPIAWDGKQFQHMELKCGNWKKNCECFENSSKHLLSVFQPIFLDAREQKQLVGSIFVGACCQLDAFLSNSIWAPKGQVWLLKGNCFVMKFEKIRNVSSFDYKLAFLEKFNTN